MSLFPTQQSNQPRFSSTSTLVLRVNPKAVNVMVQGIMRQGGDEVVLPVSSVVSMDSSTLVGNYKRTGKPLLEVLDADFPQRGWYPPAPRADGKTWDIAYPLKHEIGNYDELRFSMRSLGNLAGAGRVYVAGGQPKWLNPDTTTNIRVEQADKFTHIGKCLQAVLDSDISDDFIWMNDDILILNPVEDVPRFARSKPIREFVNGLKYTNDSTHNDFVKGMRNQALIVQAMGYDISQEFPGDTHHPMPVNKARMAEILKLIRRAKVDHPLGHFKMVYNAGMGLTPVPDPKRKAHRLHSTTEDYFSFSEESWKRQEWEARLTFRTKSPYER